MGARHDGLGTLRPGERLAVVRPDVPGYPHLGAFDDVAPSLAEGLAAAGFDVCHQRGGLVPGRRNVLLGAHLLSAAALRGLPEGTIVYNHEQVDGGSMLPPDRLEAFARLHRWDYSARNVEAWRAAGLDASHVPIGWSPGLRRGLRGPAPDIDLLFYGSMNERRRAVLEAVASHGLRVHHAFGVYGEERDQLVARSRAVLNVQYYGARILEMVRLSLLLANGVPVVTEHDDGVEAPEGIEGATVCGPYDDLVERTVEALADGPALEETGERGRAWMEAQPWTRTLAAVLPDAACAAGRAAPPARPVPAPPPPAPGPVLSPFGVVVLGMHRSGTSALTEVLSDLGLSPGRNLLGATPANPRGHFEPTPLVNANDRVLAAVGTYWHAPPPDPTVLGARRFDAVRAELHGIFRAEMPEHGWVYKDPRLCVLWDLYRPLFPIAPVGVFMARHPVSVASSLQRRDRMGFEHALDLWELHNRLALRALAGWEHAAVVSHEDLVRRPTSVVEGLVPVLEAAGMEPDAADVARAGSSIDPTLDHGRRGPCRDEELSAPRQALWDAIVEMGRTGRVADVDAPSPALCERMVRRARLVRANIRALELGWLEPTEELHRPD